MSTLNFDTRAGEALPSELWHAALQTVQTRFTRPVYEMWIKPMRPVSLDGSVLLLSVQSTFARDWVEQRLKDELSGAFSDAFGTNLDLRFAVTKDATPASRDTDVALATSPAAAATNGATPTTLDPRYSFEEFVVGNDNRFAHAAAIAVASAPARAYNPLFLYGGSGLGKTHLLRAIGQRILEVDAQARIECLTSEQFTNAYERAIRSNTIWEFRDRFREADVLLIDDVQFFAGRETAQDEFFHTFSALHEAGCQVVITSDRAPKEISGLESRLRSRFESGLLADVQCPGGQTREAILRRKATRESATPIPDDVLMYIARVVTTNVRELEGALIRVVAYAKMTSTPITLALASDVLKDVVVTTGTRCVTISNIKDVVSRAHGITVTEMDNGRRDQRLAAPRQIAMYIATELTDYSLPQLAREFRKHDHTTVMYARNKIKERMAADEAYRTKVRQLIARCQAPTPISD